MRTFWVDHWLVKPALNRIERGEEMRHLEPRVMDLLVYLAGHAGEVISRDRLIQAVWPESFVTDNALSYSINQLRQLLGDNAREPIFIETIQRRGYRLIAEVIFEDAVAETSHYELLEKLGQGGMGEVHLARDTILNRPVALKFLRPENATDELWTRRLMREARAAAALDHPFICKVYETGQLDGRDFIAMEYIEGEKLSRRIEQGPLPLNEALQISLEIAEALECAHAHGIVHRDIKPSNVILTGQGHVKITDFGIAKRFRKDEAEAEEGTLTDTSQESPGTPDYMSPEQIRSAPLDQRSDLFQFGMVLYEMLTGVHPFRRETKPETSAAILNEQPRSLRELRGETPELLQHLMDRLLSKAPDQRYQSIHEVRTDLKEVARLPEDVSSNRSHSRLWVTGLGVPATAAVVIAAAFWWWPLPDLGRASTGPLKIRPLTTEGGRKYAPRLSPDGERVAYGWVVPGGEDQDIYVRALGPPGSDPLRLTDNPGNDGLPVWSPNGRQIAFVRYFQNGRAAIYLVPSMGGPERKLVEREGALQIGRDASLVPFGWSPDGRTLIFSESETSDGPARIVEMSINTLEKRVLTTPPEDTLGDLYPEFSQDGRKISFLRSGSRTLGKLDVWVQPVGTGEARRLTELEFDWGGLLRWTPDDRTILFNSAPTDGPPQLWRVEVLTGEREGVPGLGRNVVSVDVRGDRLVFDEWQQLNWDIHRIPVTAVDRSTSDTVISSSRDDFNADISPDGSRIVFQSERGGGLNIWMCSSDGSNPVQLTNFEEHSGTPRWSPDGRRIVFDSLHSGNWDLWLIDPDGGIPRQLTTDPSDENMGTWSRDGQWIYFTSTRTGRGELYRMPSDGGAAVQLTKNGGSYGLESRDGRYVYYRAGSDPGPLCRLPTDGKGVEEQVLPKVSFRNWAVGRKGIYFRRPVRWPDFGIDYLDLETREITELYARRGDLEHAYFELAVSPDERWLLFSESPAPKSELMLAENFH